MMRLWNQPALAAALLLFYLASALYFDSLSSTKTYIFNYHLLFEKTLLILSMAFVQSSAYFMLGQRFIFYPLLSLMALFFALNDWLIDALVAHAGFYWSWDASLWLSLLALLAYGLSLRALLRDARLAWHQRLLLWLPMLLFYTHSYLNYHDFFNMRPGTYPIYENALLESASGTARSIDEFLFTAP